jgi:hypothetical protein
MPKLPKIEPDDPRAEKVLLQELRGQILPAPEEKGPEKELRFLWQSHSVGSASPHEILLASLPRAHGEQADARKAHEEKGRQDMQDVREPDTD